MKALKKPLSMLLALLMCFGVFSGMGITAFAAGEEMTTYLIDLPRSADPQKTGWDHPALNLMGGWAVDESSHFTVHAQDSFNGRAVYCIEPGVGVHTGDKYQGRDESYWDNYPSDMNPTISPSTIKEYLGRIMQYGWQGNASTAWDSRDPADAEDIAGYIATQLLVRETVVGERDSQFSHVNAAAQGKDSVTDYISANHPLYDLIFEQYDSIENQVQRHTMLPSFFSHSSASAGSYELKWDGEKYSVTLTDENNVLSNFTFTPVCERSIVAAIKAALRRINKNRAEDEPEFAYFTPHTLRHTFATRCFESGMRAKTLQEILGHNSLEMTMGLYTHVTEEMKQQELQKVTLSGIPPIGVKLA